MEKSSFLFQYAWKSKSSPFLLGVPSASGQGREEKGAPKEAGAPPSSSWLFEQESTYKSPPQWPFYKMQSLCATPYQPQPWGLKEGSEVLAFLQHSQKGLPEYGIAWGPC